MAIPEFMERIGAGEPLNALSLTDVTKAVRPDLVRYPRFLLLSELCTTDKARMQGDTAKQVVHYADITSCEEFNIIGGRGTFSGAHIDASGGTWIRVLSGWLVWYIILSHLMTDDDWEALNRDGDSWLPGEKARAIILGPGDVFIMPPGGRVAHAVLKLEIVIMLGGMIWDSENIVKILQEQYWIAMHQNATNEPFPYQTAAIMGHLRVRISQQTLSNKMRRLANEWIEKILSIGCACSSTGDCTSECSCRLQGRRCSPLCEEHQLDRSECMVERWGGSEFGMSGEDDFSIDSALDSEFEVETTRAKVKRRKTETTSKGRAPKGKALKGRAPNGRHQMEGTKWKAPGCVSNHRPGVPIDLSTSLSPLLACTCSA